MPHSLSPPIPRQHPQRTWRNPPQRPIEAKADGNRQPSLDKENDAQPGNAGERQQVQRNIMSDVVQDEYRVRCVHEETCRCQEGTLPSQPPIQQKRTDVNHSTTKDLISSIKNLPENC